MPICMIDGREAEFTPGENLVEVARRVGVVIPAFCYHPGLSVVAQCRICAVEIEGLSKLQTACSTAAKEGMVVHTDTPKVKENRRMIMEFLLINHPLDCPICDKAGECDLQDFSFNYGSPHMRYTEERRTFVDLDMGPIIKKNMNRCIHCTRCIRFGAEVAGIREMVAHNRGNKTEISTLKGRRLETEYAGNYSDICPTGSLTLKDFRFRKRAWMLRKTETTCEGCSRGCRMEVQHDDGFVYRCVASADSSINKYWICDDGRFNFHYVHDQSRVVEPTVSIGGELKITDWNTVIRATQMAIAKRNISFLLGSDLTQEEAEEVLKLISDKFKGATVFHYGTANVLCMKDDGQEDAILKMKSKTSNLYGMEKLGVKPFKGFSGKQDAVVIIRGGRAVLPDLSGASVVIGIGVFNKGHGSTFKTILPGLSFVEKSGSVFNFAGVKRQFAKAIEHPARCRSLSEILALWNRGTA